MNDSLKHVCLEPALEDAPASFCGPEWAVRVRGVSKLYGDKVALNRIDLEVRKGEVIGLLGSNGAGKTTLMEILEGLQVPTSGAVTVLGKTPTALKPAERGRIGIVFQRYALPSHLTVWQLCDLYRSMYPEEYQEQSLMAHLGLGHLLQEQIGDLSAGQRQRLSIFAALYGNKSLVILDEPTSALDVRSRRAVWSAILEKKRQGTFSGVIATHHMEEAMELCDRIYFIDNGEIKMEGNAQELLAHHSHEMTIRLTAEDDFIAALHIGDRIDLIISRKEKQVEIRCADELVGDLINHIMRLEKEWGVRVNLWVRQPSLEDVYLDVIEN
jgi:ABC-2 type transport system ATP-binding protein